MEVQYTNFVLIVTVCQDIGLEIQRLRVQFPAGGLEVVGLVPVESQNVYFPKLQCFFHMLISLNHIRENHDKLCSVLLLKLCLYFKCPRPSNRSVYYCPQCYGYLMICVKLFQIAVSVLDLVPKSHQKARPICPNFEIANSIKPALTSRETTVMVSVLEVEVKYNFPNVDGLKLPVTPLYIGVYAQVG